MSTPSKIFTFLVFFLFTFFAVFFFTQKDPASFYSLANIDRAISSITAPQQKTKPLELEIIAPPEPATSTITVLIGGDIMLDRVNRAIGKAKGYDSLFSGISPLFHMADISIANLEGPITTFPSMTLLPSGPSEDTLTFTFDPAVSPVLKRAGFTALSLANNHTDNFGQLGLIETHHLLESAGVEWFGDPFNIGPSDSSSTSNTTIQNQNSTADIICRRGICVAFVGYHEFEPGFENIVTDVRRLSSLGYPVIITSHWGDEYASTSPERVKEKARELVSAGAFAIIGAHPHVIEDREWVGNVPVIYSLGNLVFDQYFAPEVMTGNIAELTISAIPPETNGSLDILAPPKSARIDSVHLFTVSNATHNGPVIVGNPIEFPIPQNI